MELGLKDTLPFGKHKGQVVEETFKEDSSYLVWLRQIRKTENGDARFFDAEVSTLLDMEIRSNRNLQRKGFKPWNVPVQEGPVTAPGEAEEQPATVNYTGWGEF